MAFTQVTLTGTVMLSNATPASGASVTLTLNTPITDGTTIVAPEAITARCATNGTFSLVVNANDDTTTLPTGTYYEVVIGYGTERLDSFNVVVPHADAPSVNLFTLATLPNPNVVSPYVSQITAGSGITLSPAGGTGVVQVSSSGGSGASVSSPNSTISVIDNAGDYELDVVYGAAANTAAEGNDSRITGAAQLPALTESATQYVTTDGNDSNDGLSWHTAKATIQAAINALPGVAPPYGATDLRLGVVEVGYGTFNVSSQAWTDSCTFTSGSTAVTDANATNAYLGASITNFNGAWGTTIVAVNPGVGFTLSGPAKNTGTYTARISQPGVYVPPGVTLRGRGRSGSWTGRNNSTAPTLIQDNGNGDAILIAIGTGTNGTATNGTTSVITITDLSCWGNANNQNGLFMANAENVIVERCDFSYHGQWGWNLNFNPSVFIGKHCWVTWNGTAAATGLTGGVYCAGTPDGIYMEDCSFINNYGFDAYILAGQLLATRCGFLNAQVTGYSGSGCTFIQGDGGDGPVRLESCWLEGQYNGAQQVQIGGSGIVEFDSCMFEGNNRASYAVLYGNSLYPVMYKGCFFQNHGTGSLKAQSSNTVLPNWSACVSVDPYFLTAPGVTPTTAPVPAAGAAYTSTPALFTRPPAPTSVALTSGTAWQNTTGADVILAIPVTFNPTSSAAATAAIARGSTSTPTTLGTISKPANAVAGEQAVLEYYVPAFWYFEATLTNATFTANATAQPV